MIITYNKSIPQWCRPKIDIAITSALQWLRQKYPAIDFDKAQLNISMTRNRSLYYCQNGNVAIKVRHKLHLYNKQTVGLTTPKEGLAVGYIIGTTCAIIHELTHYVQGIEGRKFSEVETTMNEIDYLKETDPYWYDRLIKTSEVSKNKNLLIK